MATPSAPSADTLVKNKPEILNAWIEGQMADSRVHADRISREELTRQSREFLDVFSDVISSGNGEDVNAPAYEPVRSVLSDISIRRERLGLQSFGTAASIMSLKDHWLPYLQAEYPHSPEQLTQVVTATSRLIDTLALMTYESLVKRREATITQQTEELLEISTPVVKVWEGVVAAPLIGMLDSERTQRFMERLLQRIVETNSPIALVDITGVPAIDTQTAQHLIDTINAVKLLGSQVILTGVRPSIAQTLVHLGISLSDVRTKSSFAAGLRVAMELLDLEVTSRDRGR